MAALSVEPPFTESDNIGLQNEKESEPNDEQKKEERMRRLRDLHLKRVCLIIDENHNVSMRIIPDNYT